MVDLTSDEVWAAIARANFTVVGMVTARGEARTAGVMHAVDDGRLWFTTNGREWKARHIAAHPQVSATVAIPKRVPLLPWIAIPAATITFAGTAEIVPASALSERTAHALLHDLDLGDADADGLVAVGIRPEGDFVTYGVGVSALGMRDTERARGRVPAAAPVAVR